MNPFLEQFGIDWKLFLCQLVNFALILIILNFFVYKPMLKAIKQRNKKIQEGLDKEKEASIRLKEIDGIGREKLQEARQGSANIIKETQDRAKELEITLQKKIEEQHLLAQKNLKESYEKQKKEAEALVLKNAVQLVKQTMIKTVQLNPEAVDEALIKKAAQNLNSNEAK